MSLFHLSHEHAQNCFRTKHTSQLCRNDLVEIGNRHNDITNLSSSSECLFKQLDKNMLQLLLKLSQSSSSTARQKSALSSLIERFGICSCMSLETLVETLSDKTDYYFSHLIAPTVFDYLFLSIEVPATAATTAAAEEHVVVNTHANKRKSIFFPLLVDQSLVSPSGESNSAAGSNSSSAASIEASYNKSLVKRLAEMLEALDERGLMLSKYLVHTLKHFSRFIKVSF